MVKVHKPIPKTIKNNVSESKKIQFKITKINPTKGVAKKVMKTLAVVDTNKAENGDLRKKNELSGKIKETVAKKKQFVQKSVKTGEAKETSTSIDAPKPVKKMGVTKSQKPGQHFVMLKPSLEEVSAPVKEPAPKKQLLKAKAQQASKNSVVKHNSALEKESMKVKKNLPKKKQVVAKVHQPVEAKMQTVVKKPLKKSSVSEEESGKDKKDLLKKKPVVKVHQPVLPKVPQMAKKPLKNKSTVEKKTEEDKKELSHKGSAAAKAQQPANKIVLEKKSTLAEGSETVKKVILKKKLVSPEDHGAKQKLGKKPLASKVQNKAAIARQKKLNSKVQKKLSTEKKNKLNLKHKVKMNIENILQEDQEDISKAEQKKLSTLKTEDFDENKFKDILSLENITKACKALKVLVQKEVTGMKTAIFGEYNYFLNVACYKIPNCPKRMVKLNLKHAHVDTAIDDVVLIVPDMKRGAKVDYELTIQHYDDVLRQYGVENIKILPFNQLRNEYSSYEAKKKLSNTYDHFLCDGRIVGHVVGFCGKIFNKPRSTLHAVNLSNPKTYKSVIESGLKRTAYRQLQKGDLYSILVGNHRLSEDQLAENIELVIEQLKTIFPGSYPNIRNIYIRIDIKGTSSLPLYVSMIGAPDEVPNIIGPREQRMLNLKKQANDILSKFNISKNGNFIELNKAQIKRKQQIRKTREALTSKAIATDEDGGENKPPAKKKPKKEVELSENDDDDVSVANGQENEVSDDDDDDVSEEDGLGNEVSDDDVEESDDDEENEEDDDEDVDDEDVDDEEEGEECSEDDDE